MSSYIQPGVGGTAFVGEDAVAIYRLTALKAAVKLEAVGLRIRRGPKVTPNLARHYGLTRNNTAGIIAAIDKEIEALRAKVPVITKENEDGT